MVQTTSFLFLQGSVTPWGVPPHVVKGTRMWILHKSSPSIWGQTQGDPHCDHLFYCRYWNLSWRVSTNRPMEFTLWNQPSFASLLKPLYSPMSPHSFSCSCDDSMSPRPLYHTEHLVFLLCCQEALCTVSFQTVSFPSIWQIHPPAFMPMQMLMEEFLPSYWLPSSLKYTDILMSHGLCLRSGSGSDFMSPSLSPLLPWSSHPCPQPPIIVMVCHLVYPFSKVVGIVYLNWNIPPEKKSDFLLWHITLRKCCCLCGGTGRSLA